MIDIYRFLAFIDNLPDVRFVRDQENDDGLKLSIWDSYVTNKTVRVDTTDEDISEFVAGNYLRLLGYPELIIQLFPKDQVSKKADSKKTD